MQKLRAHLPSPSRGASLLAFLIAALLISRSAEGQITTHAPLSPFSQAALRISSGSSPLSSRTAANDPSDTLWTNARWQPGFGRPGTDGDVLAIATRGEDVFIGGEFGKVEGRRVNGIAHWDGKNWHPLGEGLNAGVQGVVNALVLDGDDLYVAGEFRAVGGILARNIARYDLRDGTWHPLGQGIGGLPGSMVMALLKFDGDLVAGGRFVVAGTTVAVNIARWDGTDWHRVGRGTNDMVWSLATDGEKLFAGGDFTIAGTGEAGKVAEYDPTVGDWRDLGTGIHKAYHSVTALAVDDRRLCIGGRFDSIAGDVAANFAILDRPTEKWSTPGGLEQAKYLGGLKFLSPNNFGPSPVQTLFIREEQLYIGGSFDTILSRYQSQAFVRYSFDADTFSIFPRLSAYTGQEYASSGVGALGMKNVRVRAIVGGEGDEIFIGGSFDFAGPKGNINREPEMVLAGNLCKLSENDTLWSAIGNGGPDGTVLEMSRQGSTLYVAGSFVSVGASIPVNGITRLDMASSTWKRMGKGLSTPLVNISGPPQGKSMAWFQGRLIVAGDFDRVDDIQSGPVAAWDTTTERWSSIGAEHLGAIEDITADADRLYVIHRRRGDRSGSECYLSIWDGSTWEQVPEKLNGLTRSIAIFDSIVYVGGDFNRVGSRPSPYIVQWDMRTGIWSPLGTNPDGPVHVLEVFDSLLYVGGSFNTIEETSSRCFGVWNPRTDSWRQVSIGIPFNTSSTVKSIHKARYGIYIGGEFTAYAYGHASNYSRAIVFWNGKLARTLGTGLGGGDEGPAVYAMTSTDSTLLVGGDFFVAGIYGVSRLATWEFPDSVYVEGQKKDGEDMPSSIASNKQNQPTTSGSSTDPDDVYWDDRFSPENHLPGTDDEIFALAPDDRGGLYAVGAFRKVVGVPAGGIAYWNGSDWEALDNGMGNGVNGVIFGLKVVGNHVYVGGQFTEAGGVAARNVAVWNRTNRTWSPLGDGIEGRSGNVPFVSDIELRNGTVYVAGNFTHAGGIPSSSIASFDSQGWHPLGSGIEGVVTSLEFFDDDLFAGGTFGVAGGLETKNIAMWDGSAWKVPEVGIPEPVNRLRMTDEGMYVAMKTDYHAPLIRKGGTPEFGYDISVGFSWVHDDLASNGGEIRDVAVSGPMVFIGGRVEFNAPGAYYTIGQRILNVGLAYRDSALGNFWNNMEGGIDGSINALVASGDQLYVAGLFTDPGFTKAENIAVWDNIYRRWRPLVGAYQLGSIDALVMHQGEVLAGGPFQYKKNPLQRFDDDNYLARLTATGWDLIEGRIQGTILDATSIDDEVIIAGRFITAELNITVNVARWNSERKEWTALTPGGGVADQEELSWASALAADQQNIYVGGLFGVVDTFETPHVARFDRKDQSWHPLGEGLDKEVLALEIGPDGALYAGGRFKHSGTTPIRGIARWNGEEWEPLGEGIDRDVFAIAFGDGKVYAAGLFDRAGDVPATNVAAFDTATGRWEAVGDGLTGNVLPGVEDLVWQNGTLFAGGFFGFSGGDTIRNVARFRNGRWERLGSGLDFAVFDLLGDRGDLYAAGSFSHAGGKTSPYIALWHDPTLSVEERPVQVAGTLLGSPNPATGTMLIRYTLPSPTEGKIVVTDATGRDVATLYSGHMKAGEGTIPWTPPNDLSAGVYFCRMVTGEGTIVRKIVLVD